VNRSFDRQALRELFDYTTFTWASYAKVASKLPAEALTREIDGSGWPALRSALFHIASAWDGWISEFSASGETVDESYQPETWAEIDRYRQRMRPMLRRIIDETAEERLHTPWLAIVPGGEAEMTPAEIIVHVLLHERGHHGDVSTLFHALGAPLPGIDYMTYAVFRNRNA
jgi:uncharacterized damage-inducible protein DinB